MTNFYLERKGFGKHTFFVVKQATGKKFRELKNSGEKIFSSRKEAFEEAQSRKGD